MSDLGARSMLPYNLTLIIALIWCKGASAAMAAITGSPVEVGWGAFFFGEIPGSVAFFLFVTLLHTLRYRQKGGAVPLTKPVYRIAGVLLLMLTVIPVVFYIMN